MSIKYRKKNININSNKNPYTVFCLSTKIPTDKYIIASVDPGIRNFAIRIESRDIKTGAIKLILFNNVDLTGGNGIDKKQSMATNLAMPFTNMVTFMNSILNYLESCHLFIIERQL